MRSGRLSLLRPTAPFIALVLAAIAWTSAPVAQERASDTRFAALRWRSIGPYRGGRVTAVAGVASQPNVYYFGATGGGVWKTEDSGVTWLPVSDGYFFTGSVGALAVAQSNPNVVYAGMGEACVRSNFSEGDGVYKSSDAGKTWTSMGLVQTKQIGRIAVHPANPDIVFVAALGNVFGPSRERGVFRSLDGGTSWRNVLSVDDETGATDLAIDPHAPDTIYATFWHVRRKPWGLFSGGKGSGLYKSIDGGNTWTELTRGLPTGIKGRIGVAVSPIDGKRVWAIVEAHDGGVFRSDDGGATWSRTNDEARIRERSWYYSHIFADSKEIDTVFVLTLQIYKSSDGGKTFDTIRPRHADNHDMWIAPDDNRRIINGNDGGANITVNGGRTWTSQDNQATAQFYRVTTDTRFPYVVYGAQQDNSTVAIPSRTADAGIDAVDWHPVGGGESGWIAPDLRDPDVVYAGSYYGLLTRYDHRTGQTRNIAVWPESPGGRPARDVKFRFQWSFPILTSPHDQGTLYAAGNVLFRSNNEGQTWTPISPDLTRNDKATQGPVGGEITGDNSSADYYATIFTVAESPKAKGTIWTGSDDGLIHVTTDGGSNWSNVTPPALPQWSRVNSIEASPHDPATAYAAVTRYQSDDRKPYVYRTTDLGKTWTVSGTGIDPNAFVRVVREDPRRRDLLFAGTEGGVYASFDAGGSWLPLQLNLPRVPITDLAIREADVVVATQGRSFWILDDISPLRQWSTAAETTATLFDPSPVYRQRQAGGGGGEGATGAYARGQNPPPGALIYFYLPTPPAEPVTLTILDAAGTSLRQVGFETSAAPGRGPAPGSAPVARQGLNRFVWDMRYPDGSAPPPKTIMFGGSTRGPLAPPGIYTVRLDAGGTSVTRTLAVGRDPRLSATDADLQQQFEFLIRVRDRVSAANDAANRILAVQSGLAGILAPSAARLPPALGRDARALDKELTSVLDALVQMKIQSGNDVLTYAIGLGNRLATVGSTVASAENRPTDQAVAAYEELSTAIGAQLARLDQLLGSRMAAVNKQLKAAGQPPVETGSRRP